METLIWIGVFILILLGYSHFESWKSEKKSDKIDSLLEKVDFFPVMEKNLELLTGSSEMERTVLVPFNDAFNFTEGGLGDFLIDALEIGRNEENVELLEELVNLLGSKEFEKAEKKSFSLLDKNTKTLVPKVTVNIVDKMGVEKKFRTFTLNYYTMKKMKKALEKSVY